MFPMTSCTYRTQGRKREFEGEDVDNRLGQRCCEARFDLRHELKVSVPFAHSLMRLHDL